MPKLKKKKDYVPFRDVKLSHNRILQQAKLLLNSST